MSCTLRRLVASAAFLGIFAGVFATPSAALADSSVVVLGLRSVEGDDEVGLALSGAIRHEATNVPGWNVSTDEITLAQMTLTFGCDEPDAACMAQVAENLDFDRIIYGTLRRTGAGDEYDFALTLYMFNATTGQLEESLTDTIPRGRTDIDDMRPRAQRYIAQFGGTEQYGSLRLQTNEPGASVSIDGSDVGTTDATGVLLVQDLSVGRHEVGVELEGFDDFESSFRVVAEEQTELRANLVTHIGPNLRWIPGAAVAAVGVVLTIVGIRASARNGSARDERSQLEAFTPEQLSCLQGEVSELAAGGTIDQDRLDAVREFRCSGATVPDPTLFQAALLITPQTDDVCTGNSNISTEIEAICDAHKRDRALQWVFYGLGVAAVTAGTIMILRAFSDEPDDGRARVDVTPYATASEGGLNAVVTW